MKLTEQEYAVFDMYYAAAVQRPGQPTADEAVGIAEDMLRCRRIVIGYTVEDRPMVPRHEFNL